MNTADCPLPVLSPDEALKAVRRHSGPVLLDFDRTLYLGDSTQDFLDSARPAALAVILLALLDLIRPWRWTGGESSRDLWRVHTIRLFMPWVAWQWPARAPRLARCHGNGRLLDVLRQRPEPPVIVTRGFAPIVMPIVEALGLCTAPLVAARLGMPGRERPGLLQATTERIGERGLRRALFLAASTDELPLAAACARTAHTRWPPVQRRSALARAYLPGRYLSRVKRPGERYILRGILQEDFAFWLLASLGLAAAPLMHTLGLALLLVSFWASYETGYVDNDRIAERHEREPKLSAIYAARPVATPRLEPWAWAGALGVAGIAAVRWPGAPGVTDLAAWAAVLGATWGWFRLYNRFDKATRIWMYAPLQFARSAAFVALVPVGAVGALALSAHVLARWVPYQAYRMSGKGWPQDSTAIVRLLFMSILFLMLFVAEGAAPFMDWTVPALASWAVYRARAQLWSVIEQAHRIDRREHPG